MKKSIPLILIIALLCSNSLVKAQFTPRFSINSSLGTSQLLTSMTPGASVSWNNSISFVPHYMVTLELENERGTLNGRNKVIHGDGSSMIASFRTSCNYWGGNVSLNLFRLFITSHKPRKMVPYLYAGVGFLDFNAERIGPAGQVMKRFTYNTYTTKVGAKLRFKMNDYIDWMAAAELSTPQSFYVDANPIPKGYDRFLSFKLGLSYKIAANESREHIDWKYYGRRQARSDWFY